MISLVISIIAILFISLTMLLRGNDFRRNRRKTDKVNAVSLIRMCGFTLAGFGPWGVVAFWLLTGQWPSIFLSMFLVGVACVFYTSPNMPPWHILLTKGSDGE